MTTDPNHPEPLQPLSAEQQEEFVRVLNEAHAMLLRYAMSMVVNRHDAEDVLQRASLVMWRRFGTFEPGTDFMSWATTVVFYEVRNFQRVTGRARVEFDDELMHILATERVQHLRQWSARTDALDECFESGPAPLVIGVPIEPGGWSGDYSAIVSEQQGVKPENGKKMLRFLRGDYEGRSIPSSHSSDVFRLVDLPPYRREFADGGAVVQLTAVCNAVSFPEDENFSATLTIFALNASLVGNEMLKADNVLSTESLAYSRSSKVVLDRDPATWQKVSNELRLPPDTDYLMLRMGMSNDTKSQDNRRDSFAGHIADKVQLVIARRPEISVP